MEQHHNLRRWQHRSNLLLLFFFFIVVLPNLLIRPVKIMEGYVAQISSLMLIIWFVAPASAVLQATFYVDLLF